MTEFISERIEVEKDNASPRPLSFEWRGQDYRVAGVVREWVDVGYGATPPASRTWYNRHHRRYYVVVTSDGDVFKLYYDYANRKSPTWWLVSKGDTP
jgi:hypothetical protein